MAAAVRQMLDGVPPQRLLVVGDRVDTDGAFATTLGCPFALVRSGVTPLGAPVDVDTAVDVAHLAAVVEALAPHHH
jgi:ribonucleotide monophosphatase NagD (HAD superfamily)